MMAHRTLFRGASMTLLSVGVVLTLLAVVPSGTGDEDSGTDTALRALVEPGDSLRADLSRLLPILESLPPDEQLEQVADWAVFLTLFSRSPDATDIRAALFDKVPIRTPGLEEAAHFDYGPGRRVIHEDGSVSLFYQSNRDTRAATLARLADQVRMELGEIPATVALFSYRPSILEGSLTVTSEERIPGQELFTPAFGYVEETVANLDDLYSWVDQVDDLTHVRLLADGSVELGGRRLAEARTETVALEDIAALYQAHTGIARSEAELEERLEDAAAAVQDSWSDLIDEYNRNVDTYNRNNFALLNGSSFAQRVSAVERALGRRTSTPRSGDTGAATPPSTLNTACLSILIQGTREEWLECMKDRPAPKLDVGRPAPDPTRALENLTIGGQYSSIQAQKSKIEALEPDVEARRDLLVQREYQRLQREGWDFSDEPGFSLDPQWDVAGFSRDMNQLLADPMGLVAQARRMAASTRDVPDPVPFLVSRARDVEDAFEEVRSWQVPRLWVPKLREARSGSGDLSSVEAEKGGLLAFYELKDEAGQTPGMDALRTLALLMFVEGRNRFQCARYDGPTEGTRVGMNLFYTDLLAKLWTIDYAASSPTSEVVGFLSLRETGETLEPTYWQESDELPAVRLWFGTKKDAYSTVEARNELNFAHMGTRVYAAGSNPLRPGEEKEAAEHTRRSLNWWDRHLNRIADYEQAYHVQNQIMKWSVATGWMVERDLLAFLDEVDVARDHRFDRWYEDAVDLRFRRPVDLVPRSRWPSSNECIDILQSQGIPTAGRITTWSGGVSLGGARSIETGTKISSRLRLGARRAGLDYGRSSADEIVSLANRRFSLTPSAARSQALVDIEAARPTLRLGTSDVATNTVRTRFSTRSSFRGVEVDAGNGLLGRFGVRAADGGPRLTWADGPLNSNRRLLSRLSSEFTTADAPLTDLARAPDLRPDRGVFLVETSEGAIEVLRPRPQILAAGMGPRPPPSALRISPPSGGSPAEPGVIRFAGGMRYTDGPSTEFVWRNFGAEAVPLEARAISRSGAREALDRAGMQTLEAVPGSEMGAPARIFTNRPVPADARRVRLTTNVQEMPTLEARVHEGILFVERPQGLEPSAFNDLVTRTGLRGDDVLRVVDAAEAGRTTVPLRAAGLDASVEPAARAAAGDLRGALDAFSREARSGNLADAVGSFRARVADDALQILEQGTPTRATRVFANAERAGAEADHLVLRAVDDLRANRILDASESTRAAARLGLDGEKLVSARSALERAGGRDLADYLAARSGAMPGLDADLANALRIEPTGFRVTTALDAGARNGRILTAGERVSAARRLSGEADVRVYVDRSLAGELDFEFAPGPTLSRAARDPRYSWVEIAFPELGELRPGIIEIDGRPAVRARLRTAEPLSAVPRIILISPCDPSVETGEECQAA